MQGLSPKGLDDNCKSEFDYALRRRGVANMIPIVMEAGCRDNNQWPGAVGFRLGGQLYHDLSAPGADEPDADKVDALVSAIRGRLAALRTTRPI